MHETTRYIDDLLTLNFPEFEQVLPPPGSGIVLSGIFPRGFQQPQVDTDEDLQASQAMAEPLPRKLLTVSRLRALSWSGSSQNQIRIW